MFKFEQVSVQMADGYRTLKNVTFEVPSGSFAVIVGGSGSGNSSLINVSAGLVGCSTGKVFVAGQNLAKMGEKSRRQFLQQIAIIRQDPMLLESHNVYENIALPLRLIGENNSKVRTRVLEALEIVGLLHKEISQISGLTASQKQRINLARCWAKNPKAVLADDPVYNLGAKDSEDLMECLYGLKEHGSTILLTISNTRVGKFKDARMRTLWRGELTH